MRKMYKIKCKVPVAFYVEAETADEAIDTIRSIFSDREDPDYAAVIEDAVNNSLDNDMVREFDAIEQKDVANVGIIPQHKHYKEKY